MKGYTGERKTILTRLANAFHRLRLVIRQANNKITPVENRHNRDEIDDDYQIKDLTWEDWRSGGRGNNTVSPILPEKSPTFNETSTSATFPFRRHGFVDEIEKHVWVQSKTIRDWRRIMIVRTRLQEYQML